VQVSLAHKDVVNDSNFITAKSVVMPSIDDPDDVHVSVGILAADAHHTSISPSARRKVVVSKGKALTLSVWHGACLLADIDIPEGLHGSVVADNFFAGSMQWSADECYVAYVAEVR
jgi:Acylamino-acid-releasing enzyme, N-terminal domain